MRNLKKFLALVLAFMMAMSLMVTANAVTANVEFPDSNTVIEEFQEDVTVLNGMGVIKGHGDTGTFAPKADVTRAQMAAIVYRLATGDASDARSDLYKEYHSFKDVKSDAWYAGYVGYCADAGYIQGYPDGTFKPNDKVTGYAALAMILRAMGYNEPGHNFVGATWKAETGSTATQRLMLVNINKTLYANTLNQPAPRELVAEMAFQGATKAMVQYTNAFGYQTTGLNNIGTSAGLTSSTQNPSLGLLYYGLTNEERIVVGNQETGETSTKLGAVADGTFTWRDAGNNEQTSPYTMYAYPGGLMKLDTESPLSNANVVYPASIGVNVDAVTGINEFGHKLDVWYDCRGTGVHTTYAFFDRAVSDMVQSDGTITSTAALSFLSDKVSRVGSAHISESFARITDETYNAFNDTVSAQELTNSPEDLYVLIDNTGNGVADVVIPMNVQTSKVTAADNVNAVKTVQVPQQTTSPVFDADTTTNWNGETTNNALIEQAALVGDSTTTIGDYEIGVRINGTRYDDTITVTEYVQPSTGKEAGDLSYGYKHLHGAANITSTHSETALYKLAKIDNFKQGQVASFNDAEGIVILSDGTRLERSVFYHTVVGNNFYTSATTAPTSVSNEIQSWQTYGSTTYKEGYTNGTYRFLLDKDGKYVGAIRVQDLAFIYGTYMDYDQVTSSSAFNYYVTGVDLNGEIVKQQQVTFFDGTPVTGTDQIGIPFRDTYGAGGVSPANPGTPVVMNGIGEGKYIGMTVNGTALNDTAASLAIIGVNQGNSSSPLVGNTNDGTTDYFATLTIRPGDVALGAKATIPASDTVGALNSAGRLYFTNNTKFILVSGYGTESVDATVYNGIEGLLDDAAAVTINFDAANSAILIDHIDATATMDEMTYFTKSDFVYAQTLGNLSEQVDTIILPEEAVTWVGRSNLYYVGNPTATLYNGNTTGNKATQFTMYQDGEAVNIWVQGLSYETAAAGNSAADVAASSDTFWQLRDTGRKTNTGEPIYQAGSYGTGAAATTFTERLPYADPSTGDTATGARPTTVGTASNNDMAHVTYRATTYDAQVAMICGALKNVGSAKIVNLNAITSPDIGTATGYVWPGIDGLATLNNAGSVAGSGAYSSQNLYVSVVYSSTNPNSAAIIYVCWDQNPTP